MDIVSFLQANWTVIVQAPWAFAFTAVMFVGIGFAVGRFAFNERLQNLESRLTRRDEEIINLKVEARSDENDSTSSRRNLLIGQLHAEYCYQHPDVPERVRRGIDPIPISWMNERLLSLGEEWRVRLAHDRDYEIVDKTK